MLHFSRSQVPHAAYAGETVLLAEEGRNSAMKTELLPDSVCLSVAVEAGCLAQFAMDIGRAILEIRRGKGLKQETVALDVGTDTGYLSRIENGSRQPSLQMLKKIANALGVNASSILALAEGSVADTENSKEEQQQDNAEGSTLLRRQFDALTPDNQRIATELLKALSRLQANKQTTRR